MTRRIAFVLATLTLSASALTAHDLFFKLDSYFLEPHSAVEVPVLNGTFQVSEGNVTPDRLLDLTLVSSAGAARLDPSSWLATGDTSYLRLRTGDPGTYVVGASTASRVLELSGDDFNEYLAHDGIPDILMERARNRELRSPARERYSKHIKAVFQVGDQRSAGFDAELGYPAELIPMGNPYGITAGGEIGFRAVVDGRPVANQVVLAGGESAGEMMEERSARTDERGEVQFQVDTPGRWYVRFIHMTPTREEGVDYESKWATLTFEVR